MADAESLMANPASGEVVLVVVSHAGELEGSQETPSTPDLAGGVVVVRGAKDERNAQSHVEAGPDGAREARVAVRDSDRHVGQPLCSASRKKTSRRR